MRHLVLLAAAVAAVVLAACAGSSAPSATAPPPSAEAAWAALVDPADAAVFLLLRHTDAPGTGDPDGFRLDDCATQRNLSPQGRDKARAVGAALRARGVDVDVVRSSQWCRCLDTARLLGLGPVVAEPALNSFFSTPAERDQRTAAARSLLAERHDVVGVEVLVTHLVNVQALTGVTLGQGEALVVRADADGATTEVGRIADW